MKSGVYRVFIYILRHTGEWGQDQEEPSLQLMSHSELRFHS